MAKLACDHMFKGDGGAWSPERASVLSEVFLEVGCAARGLFPSLMRTAVPALPETARSKVAARGRCRSGVFWCPTSLPEPLPCPPPARSSRSTHPLAMLLPKVEKGVGEISFSKEQGPFLKILRQERAGGIPAPICTPLCGYSPPRRASVLAGGKGEVPGEEEGDSGPWRGDSPAPTESWEGHPHLLSQPLDTLWGGTSGNSPERTPGLAGGIPT